MSLSSSYSLDNESDNSLGIRNKRYSKTWKRYRWKSDWEYVIMTVAATLKVQTLYSFIIIEGQEYEPTIIHYILTYIFVGFSVAYMQVIMGQYTQRSIIFIKHLSPIGHGIGYVIIINGMMKSIMICIILADFLIYFLTSMQKQLQWMICPKNRNHTNCWDINSSCKKNCINDSIEISAYVYWKEVFMDSPHIETTELVLGVPMLPRFLMYLSSWIMIYCILLSGINRYKKIIRINLYILCGCFSILLLVCFVTSGSSKGVFRMFTINPKSFVSLKAWTVAVYTTMEMLGFGTPCHMIYGSYMPPNTVSDILVIVAMVLNFIGNLFGSIIVNSSLGIILHNAGLEGSDMKYIWNDGRWLFLSVIPQGIGFMGVPQIWTMIYFLICMLLIVNNVVTVMDNVERSISDAHPRMRSYRNYVQSILCLINLLLGILFLPKESLKIVRELFNKICPLELLFVITLMCAIVFWIYYVQRLCDDIHFLLAFQPTKFWKLCWYFLPILTGLTFVYQTFYLNLNQYKEFKILNSVIYILLVSPIPILGVYEIFRYLQIHNLVGLFQPTERWGPPDPRERHLRRVFNPREEIHSRRRSDTCQHKCLLGSKILKEIIAQEEAGRFTSNNLSSTINLADSMSTISEKSE